MRKEQRTNYRNGASNIKSTGYIAERLVFYVDIIE